MSKLILKEETTDAIIYENKNYTVVFGKGHDKSIRINRKGNSMRAGYTIPKIYTTDIVDLYKGKYFVKAVTEIKVCLSDIDGLAEKEKVLSYIENLKYALETVEEIEKLYFKEN